MSAIRINYKTQTNYASFHVKFLRRRTINLCCLRWRENLRGMKLKRCALCVERRTTHKIGVLSCMNANGTKYNNLTLVRTIFTRLFFFGGEGVGESAYVGEALE